MGTSPYDDGWLAGIELEGAGTTRVGHVRTGGDDETCTLTCNAPFPERPSCVVRATSDDEIDIAAAARVRAFLGPIQGPTKR